MKVSNSTERLNELFDSDPRTDTAIAQALGVSKQSVSSWRAGIRSPKKPVLIKISELYNVSIEWLMGFDVDRTPPSDQHIVIPNTELFMRVIQHMDPEDYRTVIDAYERTYRKMIEMGEI